MKFEELKKFILETARTEKGRVYRPVVIKTLIQNNGHASKEQIVSELQKANQDYPSEEFSNHPIFKELTETSEVMLHDDYDATFRLNDFDSLSEDEKSSIVLFCNQRIDDPFIDVLKEIEVEEVVSEFQEWMKSEKALDHVGSIEKEKSEVKELMNRLSKLDKNSQDFTNHVLYGLLPYSKSRFAKRISNFPAFLNIKPFLKGYGYSEEDWNKIANRIYVLVHKFQIQPEGLEKWIGEFTSDAKYARSIQCGSISPVLFCINDSYPVVNNKIKRTYAEFSQAFGWNDKISQKLVDYPSNVQKCKALIERLGTDAISNLTTFDLFCWWYEDYYQKDQDDEGEVEAEEEEETRTGVEDIDYRDFFSSMDLDDLKQLEPHVLPNPERIKIRELLQHCERGTWQLPNFQRYFDWKKTDIRDLLESIFRDFYVGSLLLWKIDREPALKLIPINGVKITGDDAEADKIILDGQQRITSLQHAIKGVKEPTRKIANPVYFYINFRRFIQCHEDRCIEILNHRLSREDSIKKLFFPFYELEKYDEWIDAFEDEVGSQENYKKTKEVRRLIEKKLKHFIDGFEIPYIVLPSTVELHQVTDIFERLNTRGKVLSVFDILTATLSKYDIDLRQLWDKTERNHRKLKEYNSQDKIPIYILQSIALSHHDLSLCGREDLLKIYPAVFEPKDLSFDEIWEDAVGWINRAIAKLENFRDGYGVKGRKSLPYLPTIPILASLLKEISGRQNKVDCYKKLDAWYWSSIFSEMYSSGVDTKLTTDYREMLDWFDDDAKTARSVEKFRREFPATLNLREVERENSSIFRGILSLIALESAPDFDTSQSLENAPENDRHHIFPKKTFKKHPHVKSVLNLTWMADETNKKIGAKKPSVYIREFIGEKYDNDEEKFMEVLARHLIGEDGYRHLLNDDLDGFIEEREQSLRRKIAALIGIGQPETDDSVMITPQAPFSN